MISIITPYYKTLPYIQKLAKVLEPQLTDDIEWIIIDDGCHEQELDKLKAIHECFGLYKYEETEDSYYLSLYGDYYCSYLEDSTFTFETDRTDERKSWKRHSL